MATYKGLDSLIHYRDIIFELLPNYLFFLRYLFFAYNASYMFVWVRQFHKIVCILLQCAFW